MLRTIAGVLLLLGTTAAAVAPAFDSAASRSNGSSALSNGTRPVALEQSSPTPSAAPTYPDDIVLTPEPEPTATPARTPERTAAPTWTPPARTEPPAWTPKPALTAPTTPARDQVWEALVKACLGTLEPQPELCYRTLSYAGISLADFRAKVASRFEVLAQRDGGRVDLETLIKACVASQNIESDACVRAWQVSGLSLADFRAKVAAILLEARRREELYAAMKSCFDSYQLYGPECQRAFELASALMKISRADFDAKVTAEWDARARRTAP